jgi:hypothetical protein
LLALALPALLSAAEIPDLLLTLKAVGPEGRGNAKAAQAWKELAASKSAALPAILAGLDDANPLAANYLRSAVETIVQRELTRGERLPSADLEAFLKDTRHDSRARRLAFDILARVDKTATDRLIPGMLGDPSVELRRDAVQRLVDLGEKQFEKAARDDARGTFVRALAAARDDDQVQALKKRLEELGEKVDLARHFGFLTNWRLVAPFDNTDNKGFAFAYPPEKAADFGAEYEGKGGMKIRWVPHATDDEYGIVDVATALAAHKGAVAYAAAEFVSDKGGAVDIRLGTPNSWRAWLNGELLFARDEYHRNMSLDQYKLRGTLKPGKNVILVKLCQNEQSEDWAQRWQFQLRVCDATGTAILSTDRAALSTGARPPAGD